jgi:hypothetical protein
MALNINYTKFLTSKVPAATYGFNRVDPALNAYGIGQNGVPDNAPPGQHLIVAKNNSRYTNYSSNIGGGQILPPKGIVNQRAGLEQSYGFSSKEYTDTTINQSNTVSFQGNPYLAGTYARNIAPPKKEGYQMFRNVDGAVYNEAPRLYL